MKQAILYMKYVFHDLDIVINKSKGKLAGYSYQAGGKKIGELEEFIKSSLTVEEANQGFEQNEMVLDEPEVK